MAQLDKLREEKFFKNNQGTTLESRLQHYPKNICTQILLQGKWLAWQAIHQQKDSNSIWNPLLASTVEICILLHTRELRDQTVVFHWASTDPVPCPFHPLCLTGEHLCLYLPSLLLAGTHKCSSSALTSLDTLGSMASFQVHFLRHVNSFFSDTSYTHFTKDG